VFDGDLGFLRLGLIGGTSVPKDHLMVHLGEGRILDLHRTSGLFKVWDYRAFRNGNVVPGQGWPTWPHQAGGWPASQSGVPLERRSIVHLQGGVVLDWVPETGYVEVLDYDWKTGGNPFQQRSHFKWPADRANRRLVSLGQYLLDWEPATGHYRAWRYDWKRTGYADPAPERFTEGRANSLQGDRQLLFIGDCGPKVWAGGLVLDWEPPTGRYATWRVNHKWAFEV
jgi:hypothetical protein